jgi:glycosyltransferase involved in cell wall biosynthesis
MNARNFECWQINLQEGYGGGEVYTDFLTRALLGLGVRCHVFVSRRTGHWIERLPANAKVIAIDRPEDVQSHLPTAKTWILSHGGLASSLAHELAARHRLSGIAHMPLYGRRPDGFVHHHRVYGVSAYVCDSLRDFLRSEQVYDDPLYGIAHLPASPETANPVLRRRSRYDWDRRKGRDRLLARLEPWVEPWLPHPEWTTRPGLTLGIVSRLTPIKQFPLLFSHLVPQLLAQPKVNLEIVGAGGYASVRDLSRVLEPLGKRVRYWGHQADVRTVYGKLDFLLTGLPEKEALGLNVIEAQACGLPVLAVRDRPFTETVLESLTGYFFEDPRRDDGRDFGQLLNRIFAGNSTLFADTTAVRNHLDRFSAEAFTGRIKNLLADPALDLQETTGT